MYAFTASNVEREKAQASHLKGTKIPPCVYVHLKLHTYTGAYTRDARTCVYFFLKCFKLNELHVFPRLWLRAHVGEWSLASIMRVATCAYA